MSRPEPTPLASIDYYDDLAATLADAYDTISFEEVHPGVAPYLPSRPSHVLDVGAGSGRDARALAALGHSVVAVEPSEAFRSVAVREGDRLRWVDDRLPDLPRLTAEGRRFSFILCSAVLMLVPATQLGRSFATFAALLTPGGALAVSVRAPAPGEPEDVFHAHANADIVGAAARAGLELAGHDTPPDALGRQTLRWRSFVFTSRG